MTDDDLRKQKEVEFYAAGVAAWYNTMLEHDKSLLALSAGGIGLLITLLTAVGVSSVVALVLHLLAIFSFLLCLVAILFIFKKNSGRIEVVLNTDAQPPDPILTKLDNIAVSAFATGIIFSSVIGVFAAINSYSNKEKIMANENKQKTGFSANDVSNLKLAGELNKSFNPVNNLKPFAPQGSSNSTSGASQPVTPAATPVTNKK